MAAATLLDVMDGIEAALLTIAGLRVSDIKPGQINPPQAVVGVPPVPQYRITMGRGYYTPAPTVIVATSAAVDRVGQRLLAEFAAPAGPRSIAAALEADLTLGGRVTQCWVEDFRPLGFEDVGVLGYFGGLFTINVVAGGA